MKRKLSEILAGDVPDDVCHWIVEYHYEADNPDINPLQAVKEAAKHMSHGHGWTVTHVRSGLQFSVDLSRNEMIEVRTVK